MSKIYLIGMPGSGKTTLGKKVASALLLDFVDLDLEIEKREQKSIPEIFSHQGEDYFRQVESALLHEWAASDKSFVMATGGGAPCFYNGIEVINNSGISIFLDVPIDKLARRVEDNTDRPLLKAEDYEALKSKLEKIRESRIAIYHQAKITLQKATVNMILHKLQFKRGNQR